MTMYESNREVGPTGAEPAEFLEAPADSDAADGVRSEPADFAGTEPEPDPVPDRDDRPVRGVKWAEEVLEERADDSNDPIGPH